jgi:hypothetical protein
MVLTNIYGYFIIIFKYNLNIDIVKLSKSEKKRAIQLRDQLGSYLLVSLVSFKYQFDIN